MYNINVRCANSIVRDWEAKFSVRFNSVVLLIAMTLRQRVDSSGLKNRHVTTALYVTMAAVYAVHTTEFLPCGTTASC